MPIEEHILPEGAISIKGKKARTINFRNEPRQVCVECNDTAYWWVGQSPEKRDALCNFHFMNVAKSSDILLILSEKMIKSIKEGTF